LSPPRASVNNDGMANRIIVLLRAVNVGGRKLIMADLRAAAEHHGFANVSTYIQSGNLLLTSDLEEAVVESEIEALIEREFGLAATAIARTADRFARLAATNPFPEALPNRLHLCLTKQPPRPGCAAAIQARGQHGERAQIAGEAVWIDFPEGAGSSKLTPAFLDKAAGSPLTARNWNTVQKLIELVRA
jgi:uncharacterized protein (DUF1697 family)